MTPRACTLALLIAATVSVATAAADDRGGGRIIDTPMDSAMPVEPAAFGDRGGNLVALRRDDNVGPHNTLAAQRKAYTALSSKTPTRLFAERAAATPDAANLNTLDELLLLGGGVPLKVGDEVIGAIGVAGAGGAKNDEACAMAAIEKLLPSSH